jgi:indole-3-glycerol phosphate synthase
MHILDKICAHKKDEVAQRKRNTSVEQLKDTAYFQRKCYSIVDALAVSNTKIIAEFKRKSPSKQAINLEADVAKVTSAYKNAGVAGISVLTDHTFFGGSHEHLKTARETVSLPLLQKDFVLDAFQIYEAKAYGADFVLLIAAVLSIEEIQHLSGLAHELGMEVLVEIHDEVELQKVFFTSVDVVGVNNRNLKTFEVDLAKSKALIEQIPAEFVKITESGIAHPMDFACLRNAGFEGFLMGETFMKEAHPEEAIKQFMNQVNQL